MSLNPIYLWQRYILRWYDWHPSHAPKDVKAIDGSTIEAMQFCWRRKVDGGWQYRAMSDDERVDAYTGWAIR